MAKFRLTTEHKYWWPVTIDLPDPDKPGKWTTQSMTMQFVSMTADEARAIQERIDGLPTDKERAEAQHDHLIAASCDWRDVVDDDGEAVPFTQEALRSALSITWYRVAIYRAWAKSQVAEEGRKGN